jgi:diguanylate cyclase (GGDEF)-like protein
MVRAKRFREQQMKSDSLPLGAIAPPPAAAARPGADRSGFGHALEPRRLTQILWASIAAAGTILVTGLTGNILNAMPAMVGVLLLLVAALRMMHLGRVRQAAALALGTLTLGLSYLLYENQGIQGPGVMGYASILVLAAMFGTRRLYLSTLATMVVVLTAITVANLRGWHVNVVRPVSMPLLVILLTILLFTGFIIWRIASDLCESLASLKSDNDLLRASRTHIDFLAHHDVLTGLPNRVLARIRLDQAIAAAEISREGVALLLIDLDDFRTVNESLGHATGDLLLCDVAARIRNAVRPGDLISRQGGDEFLVIMAGVTDEESISATAAGIIRALSQPFHVKGLELTITCSLGIALCPKNGNDFENLLKSADVAMYRAKDSGRNAFRFFNAEMNRSVVETLHLISGIRSALALSQFQLYYQPLYDLRSGRVVGAEALIRWRHPELGFIAPAKFIPVAERSGLIHEIGVWVLNEACRQAREWQSMGLADLVVSVNLSPLQFRRDSIEREVVNALAAAQLPPSSIELELTESLLIDESGSIGPMLARLRSLGVRFSIDDFGTGYCNLGYLKRFSVQRLKIDQSFVRQMVDRKDDESIVRAIIDVAHGLQLEVVAEGVENAATLLRLIELGCDFGQGFHWSGAMPPGKFLAFLGSGRDGSAAPLPRVLASAISFEN